MCISTRCVSLISQQPWRGSTTSETDSTYASIINADIAIWKIQSVGGLGILPPFKPTSTSANFDHQSSPLIRNQILQNIPAVMKYRISVTRFQEKSIYQVHWQMLLALSPIKSLFQIARRRRTSRIFTTDEFNVVKRLLTSAAPVLKNSC